MRFIRKPVFVFVALSIAIMSLSPREVRADGGSKVAGGLFGGLIGALVGGAVGTAVGLSLDNDSSKLHNFAMAMAIGAGIGIAVGATVGVLLAYDPLTGQERLMTAQEMRLLDQQLAPQRMNSLDLKLTPTLTSASVQLPVVSLQF